MQLELNIEELASKLERMKRNNVILFMISCSERLYPNYEAFSKRHIWGNPKVLRGALDFVWMTLESNNDFADIDIWHEECERITPDTEEFGSVYGSFALNAAASVITLLDYLIVESVDKAIEIATLSRDTIDLYIQESENLSPIDPDREQKITTHPLMQLELKRQKEDIDLLERFESINKADIIKLKEAWRGQKSNIEL